MQRNENGKMGYFLSDEEFGVLYQAQQSLRILCAMLYSLHKSRIVLNTEELGCMLDYPTEALTQVLDNLET